MAVDLTSQIHAIEEMNGDAPTRQEDHGEQSKQAGNGNEEARGRHSGQHTQGSIERKEGERDKRDGREDKLERLGTGEEQCSK